MAKLCVNIDHIATLREVRKIDEPDPVYAAVLVQLAGADGIVVHPREDRRHINERDVRLIKEVTHTKLDMEMAVADEIVQIALDVKPEMVTLVPEKREEVTTEGGLDVIGGFDRVKEVVGKMKKRKIVSSLFIDPDSDQIKAAKEVGAEYIEIHTGAYCNVKTEEEQLAELEKVRKAVKEAMGLGLRVNAGHGLNYVNVVPIAQIEGVEELNIGHSIIGRAVFVGLENAVKEMITLIK